MTDEHSGRDSLTRESLATFPWTQHLLLDGELAKAEPKTLRYRLLHTAARITHGQRRTRVRIQQSWPWALDLARAFTRLRALPVPAG